MNLLLTGARHFVARSVVHEHHEKGDTVYTADSVDFDYTRFSRFVKKSYRVPSVRFDESGYIEALVSIIKTHRIDELLPLGEETFFIARHLSELIAANPRLIVHTGTIGQLETLHNKAHFAELAASLGLTIPKSRLVSTPDEVIDFQKEYGNHIVLKSPYSRFGAHITELHEPASIDALAQQLTDTPYIAQQYISGEELSSFSETDTSPVITYKSALPLHRPAAMPSIEKLPTPDEIGAVDAAIRGALNYTHQLGLDFIKAEDGTLYLLEANPRATSGRMLTDRPRIQSRLIMFHYFLGGLIPLRLFMKWLWIFTTYPDSLFSRKDWRPALASQVVGLREYLAFRRQHPSLSFRDFTSYDMEYNGSTTFTSVSADNSRSKDILNLLETIPTKGMLRMVYTRRPDAVASFLDDGPKVDIQLIEDSSHTIAYMSVCAQNSYYLNGKPTDMGYVSALRKNQSFAYRIPWFDLFFKQYEQTMQSEYFFCSVMRSNTHAIDVVTRRYTDRPPFKQVGSYTLYIANTHRISRTSVDGVSFHRAETVDGAALREFLTREGAKRPLFPTTVDIEKGTHGVNKENSYVLMKGATIVGFGSVVDQRSKKQFIIQQYAWYLRVARLLNPLWKALGLMSLPKPGEVIHCPTLTHLLVSNDDPELHALLVGELAHITAPNANLCMLALPDKSPHRSQFESGYHMKIRNNLYMMNKDDKLPQIDETLLYTDALLLY